MKSNAAFGVIYGTVEISSVGSTAYWGDLAVLVALTTLKWTGAGFGLLVALVVALVAHLTYKLSSRWSKLKVAALHEAEVIKKRKQGPTWDAQEILPGVWLGSFPAAIKADELRRRNISHVLSIGSEFSPVYPEQFCYMVAFAMDCPGQNIVDYFEHTNRFIDSALSSGSAVLVHWCVTPFNLYFPPPFHSQKTLQCSNNIISLVSLTQFSHLKPSGHFKKRLARGRLPPRSTRAHVQPSPRFHSNYSSLHRAQSWLPKTTSSLGTHGQRTPQRAFNSSVGSFRRLGRSRLHSALPRRARSSSIHPW